MSDENILVRNANVYDINTILNILGDSFGIYSNQFTPSALKLKKNDIKRDLPSWYVFCTNNTAVACVMAYKEDDYFTFCYMAVLPEYKNRTIGKKLTYFIFELAKKKVSTGLKLY